MGDELPFSINLLVCPSLSLSLAESLCGCAERARQSGVQRSGHCGRSRPHASTFLCAYIICYMCAHNHTYVCVCGERESLRDELRDETHTQTGRARETHTPHGREVMCCTPSRNSTTYANKRHLPGRATRLSVSPRWPARANTGKTASALRICDLRSTDSMCSSSSATWNDVRFELKHRARIWAQRVSSTHDELAHG